MAFAHAKNARVFLDGFDLSYYFNEVTMQAKVDLADTTTFAKTAGVSVAKTVIPGVKDGTIQLKGLFDSTPTNLTAATTGEDNYFYTLIAEETGVGQVLTPSNVEACLSVAPEGSWAAGRRVWAAAGVASSYQISSPVKNAVTIQADIQCDGGVNTGVSLHDPTVSDTMLTEVLCTAAQTLPVTTLNAASTTAAYPASGQLLVPVSGGYSLISYTGRTASTFTGCTGGTGTTLGAAILPVYNGTGVNDQSLPSGAATLVTVAASITLTTAAFALTVTGNPITKGFPDVGQILVPTSGGAATINYSGISPTQFLNCTGGAGQVTSAGNVTQPPVSSVFGGYAFLHVGALGGTSAGIQLAKLQHSDDNSTWTDVAGGTWTINSTAPGNTYGLGQYGSGQYSGGTNGVGTGNSGTGGYILALPAGTVIQRFVRVVLAYAAPTTSAAVLVTFVRL